MSKSSTSTCVLSLISAGKWNAGPWKDNAAQTLHVFLTERWQSAELKTNNPFTVAFVLEAAHALTQFVPSSLSPRLRRRMRQAEKLLKTEISTGSVSLLGYPPSAYLTQLVTRVLATRNAVDDATRSRILDWSWRELDHQLALLHANSKNADVFQLAYCMILVSDVGDPGEATPEQSLILQTALDVFFERQLPDGSWPRSRPLFHYPGVGSAYCYEYELLVQMLHSPSLLNRLLKYLPKLQQAALYLDETVYSLPNGGLAWTSGHHPQLKGPESWSTASVFHFSHRLERLTAEQIRRVIFEELDVVYDPPGEAKTDARFFAPNFLDCPLRYNNQALSLRDTLFEKFVEPIAKESKRVAEGRSMAKDTPMSAIFFGPPGTSKTQLARAISDYLVWPRLVVDPSYFVKTGMDNIQAQADKLFSMLSAAERIVVLLDEFDEMVRARERSEDVLSRFLTTAMLPKLATINESRKIVFLVATNYIENFDLAISRRGRFDLIIQVMPPTVTSKLKKWGGVGEKVKAFGLGADSHVRSILELLTYDEFAIFAAAAERVDNPDGFIRVAEEFASKSTLRSQATPEGDGSTTWQAASADQETKIRLP
jgi:hypothetical protein